MQSGENVQLLYLMDCACDSPSLSLFPILHSASSPQIPAQSWSALPHNNSSCYATTVHRQGWVLLGCTPSSQQHLGGRFYGLSFRLKKIQKQSNLLKAAQLVHDMTFELGSA
jgi:hypothetical protein